MRTAEDVLAIARELAGEVLFPAAMRVDRLDVLPAAYLDALAAAGLYGAPAPAEAGGLGLDLRQVANVIEELASGSLAAAFVLIQHFRLVMTLAGGGAPAALRDRWLASACRGSTRGGIALTGLIPGPPQLRAEPAGGGWRLDGTSPWVTGWGLIDLVQVVARGPGDTVVTLIMDAADQPGLAVTRQRLAAIDAAVTVRLGFERVLLPAERFVDQVPFDPAASVQPAGLRLNGSLALGVSRRCARLFGPSPLDDEVTACRDRLDAALGTDPEPMAVARAAASELALRAAAALTVRDGGNSITVDEHPQRLAREALFLLVFGSRPGIKNALLYQLGAAAVPSGRAYPSLERQSTLANRGRRQMTTMARFLALWGTPEDPEFFEHHYREVHVPLVLKLPGVRRYTFSRDARPVRGDLYYRIGEVDFDDISALQRAFASPEGRAAASDVDTLSSTAGAQVRSMIYELEEL